MNSENIPTKSGFEAPFEPFQLASRLALAPALVNLLLVPRLWSQGVTPVGVVLSVVLPVGALALIARLLRDRGFRTRSRLITVREAPRRFWFTVSLLGMVYTMATVALLVSFVALRS